MITLQKISVRDIQAPVSSSGWTYQRIKRLFFGWKTDGTVHTVCFIESEHMVLVLSASRIGYQCTPKEWDDFVLNFGPLTE
jgi:hypothetical protein